MQLHERKRIFGLDLMRAIAILLVVFSHIAWIMPNKVGLIPDIMSISGVLGVEIFFVLSGFLIGKIIYSFYTSENFSKKDVYHFWVRRWFRTLPNYYLALLLNIIVVMYIGIDIPDNFWRYLIFIQNVSWQIPAFFYESWSLTIEEFAYILGPLIMYLFFLMNRKYSRSLMFLYATLLIILFITITKIYYNNVSTTNTMEYWNINLKSIIIYRLDAIYYGVLAVYISIKKPILWKHFRVLGFILGGLIFIGINLGVSLKRVFIEDYPFFWNVIYLPINSIVIVLFLPFLSQWRTTSKWLMIPITRISILSYAIYVLHYSVILQLLKYFIPTQGLSGLDIFVYVCVYLCLVFFTSYFLYTYFEKPMTNIRERDSIKHLFK